MDLADLADLADLSDLSDLVPDSDLLGLGGGIELIQIASRQRRGGSAGPKVIWLDVGPILPHDHRPPLSPVTRVAAVRLFVGDPLPEAFQ